MDSVYFVCNEVRLALKELPDGVIQCAVTSPPYWSLRDYKSPPTLWEDGWEGALGMEPTPDQYADHLVEVFREVRRVLRDDGCLWLNLGDSFCSSSGQGDRGARPGSPKHAPGAIGRVSGPNCRSVNGLKPKDIVGIPWLVAFALRADGWYLRAPVVWRKPNCLPESVRDRPVMDYEHIFLLTKSERYYYDRYAVLEPYAQVQKGNAATFKRNGSKREAPIPGQTVGTHRPNREDNCYGHGGRNLRAVWDITTKALKEKHFASFPPELPKKCLCASTSEYGSCAQCGTPYARIVEKGEPLEEWRTSCGADSDGEYHGTAQKDYAGAGAQNASATKARILAGMVAKRTVGWAKTCRCETDEVAPCLVMDPFAGSGTTGMVAKQLGLRAILIDQSEEYVRMARKRCGVEDDDEI